MITSVQKLTAQCKVCNARADWSITKTNDDLPDGYFKHGQRREDYCEEHLPGEARRMIQAAWDHAMTPI